MFKVSKRFEIAGAHRLELPYESKCNGLHGHNWIITVCCKSKTLNAQGMVVDSSRSSRAFPRSWTTPTSMT